MAQETHFSLSIKNPEKSKCGDASFSGSLNNGVLEFILLLVADGVSKSPKDYLASASVVRFIKEYLETYPITNICDSFKKAVIFANTQLYNGVEGTSGMLSTLSALIYLPRDKYIYTVNIGDSRIYGYNDTGWNLLSKDDTKRVPYKENGKLKLLNRMPIYMSGLTKAMGERKSITIQMSKYKIQNFSGFALLTDGFYNLYNWEIFGSELFHTVNTKLTIERISVEILREIRDDATLSMLRIPIQDISRLSIYELCNSSYSLAMLLPIIKNQIELAFKESDNIKINELVKLIAEYKILDTRPNMIILLEKTIKFQIPEASQTLTRLIRKM